MSISQADVDRLRRAVLASLHEHWRFYLIEGIILIALGAAAIVVPPIATLTVTIFCGLVVPHQRTSRPLHDFADARSAGFLVVAFFRSPRHCCGCAA